MTEPARSSTTVDGFLAKWCGRLSSTGQHRKATDRLLDLYRQKGLLPGERDEALFCCCPHRKECWHDAPDAKDPRNSGIALPWIGRAYFDLRVAILGMNFDNFGGLAGHYWTCVDHIQQMEAGKRGKDGRAFARGAMQYLRIVLAGLTDEDLSLDSADVSNEELAGLWEQCAYLQTIKCAPGSPRSNPTAAMIDRCPSFITRHELTILKPQVVMVLGRGDLRDVVRPWAVRQDGYGREQGPRLERDTATIDERAVELISLNHPSARPNDVAASLEQLIASLKKRPLATPRQV